MGISQSVPRTGYIKMVDVWMIFTMFYPFFVIACHCALEVIFFMVLIFKGFYKSLQILITLESDINNGKCNNSLKRTKSLIR